MLRVINVFGSQHCEYQDTDTYVMVRISKYIFFNMFLTASYTRQAVLGIAFYSSPWTTASGRQTTLGKVPTVA